MRGTGWRFHRSTLGLATSAFRPRALTEGRSLREREGVLESAIDDSSILAFVHRKRRRPLPILLCTARRADGLVDEVPLEPLQAQQRPDQQAMIPPPLEVLAERPADEILVEPGRSSDRLSRSTDLM